MIKTFPTSTASVPTKSGSSILPIIIVLGVLVGGYIVYDKYIKKAKKEDKNN